MRTDVFLSDMPSQPWVKEPTDGFHPVKYHVGKGALAVEVAVAGTNLVPKRGVVLREWKAYLSGRSTPVLLVTICSRSVCLCGFDGDQPTVRNDLDMKQVEWICREALSLKSKHVACRFLTEVCPSLDTDIPGLDVDGPVSAYNLQRDVPSRDDWGGVGTKG